MPEWGRSPGWPTRNFTMPECCSRDLCSETSSGRGSCSITPGPSPDNSVCGRLRYVFQTSAGKQQNRSTKLTNGSPREVERDETFVLVRAIDRADAVGGLIRHETHVDAGRERLHCRDGAKHRLISERSMPQFLIERNFAEQIEMTKGVASTIKQVNDELSLRWVFSFLSADKKKTYCLYEAPSAEAIREAAKRLNIPADKIIELGGQLRPEMFE